jgi:fimbrial isopeptide formation D2 family protein/LPXTG-motif cell wall-anchored protein
LDVDLTDPDHPVYTLSGDSAAAKVTALASVFDANLGADGKYYITLKSGITDEALFTALGTIVAANATLFPGTEVTSDDNPVTLNVGDDGYFFIKASNGKDVAVQTSGSVTITEKNDYPTITKEQKKAADPTYTEAVIPAEIGTYHDYKVTVHIPTDATKSIAVIDTMTAGLDYDENTGLTLNPNVTYSPLTSEDDGYNANAAWQIKFSSEVVEANRGNDIVITYRALITEAALTDTGRENEVTLNYDDGNYILKDETNYTSYFTGIEKVDGENSETKLEGVKFTLTANGVAYNVVKSGDYYIPTTAEGSTNEVETDANGLIIIRGLDNSKGPYVLTETETNDGYNLLAEPKNLTLVEDTTTAYATDNFDQVVNNKGTVLPSTGGIGTTIFYILGGLLVIGAAVILVARRKAQD